MKLSIILVMFVILFSLITNVSAAGEIEDCNNFKVCDNNFITLNNEKNSKESIFSESHDNIDLNISFDNVTYGEDVVIVANASEDTNLF